jgi:hypothetical protein
MGMGTGNGNGNGNGNGEWEIKSLEFSHFTNNSFDVVHYTWSQFNFLRLQINITEYTFVYVLR